MSPTTSMQGSLLWTLALVVCTSAQNVFPVWPLAEVFHCTAASASTPALVLSPSWAYSTSSTDPIVLASMKRYQPILSRSGDIGVDQNNDIKTITVEVINAQQHKETGSSTLGPTTNYSHSISSSGDTVNVVAQSAFGVAYAFESLSQIITSKQCSGDVVLSDKPVYIHRGIMVDTGRRFYPVSLIKSILDGMETVKMNVLHFHLSEECFRIQSVTYPNLTATCSSGSYTNLEAYTHTDIAGIVQYALERGVRVIPEFDMPGHSGGFCTNLKSAGLQCCGNQIEDSADNTSAKIIGSILTEMAALFPDPVMNLGCDETGSAPPCTMENTKTFEIKMIQHLISIGKQPMGWEEILFKTGAAEAFPSVIVDSWARTSWNQAAAMGHQTVVSRDGTFYLDSPSHSALGMWVDITDGNTNTTQVDLLLGGEVSMWSDHYVGSCMFESPSMDDVFANSTSMCIWPRSVIAAGSFWRYNKTIDGTAAIFNATYVKMQQRLKARDVTICPCSDLTSTQCSQSGACGDVFCKNGPSPSGDVYRCSDYYNTSITSYQCHTAWTGNATLLMKAGVKINCSTNDECLTKSAAMCDAMAGCGIISLDSTVSPSVGGGVASFFSKAPRTQHTRTSSLYGVACDGTDPAQGFTFYASDGTLKNSRGKCVDTRCHSDTKTSACTDLSLNTCDGSDFQKWKHSADGGSFMTSSGTCMDMYFGGKGPNIGVYTCDDDWNQFWIDANAGYGFQEEDDGRCMSDSMQGADGLVWTGPHYGKTNAWTKLSSPQRT